MTISTTNHLAFRWILFCLKPTFFIVDEIKGIRMSRWLIVGFALNSCSDNIYLLDSLWRYSVENKEISSFNRFCHTLKSITEISKFDAHFTENRSPAPCRKYYLRISNQRLRDHFSESSWKLPLKIRSYSLLTYSASIVFGTFCHVFCYLDFSCWGTF